MSEIINVSGKIGVKVVEYKGVYSLRACYGDFESWCKPKIGKESYGEKDRPMEVTLGGPETAKKVLTEIMNEIK